MSALGDVLGFLLEHLDVIELLVSAINGGVKKDEIKAAIRRAQVEAADKQMHLELDRQG